MKKVLLILCTIICLSACGGESGGTSGSSDSNSIPGSNNPDTSLVTDTEKPSATLSINQGAPTTTSNRVSLRIHASDNNQVVGYFLSSTNTSPDISASGWVATEQSLSSVDINIDNYLLTSGGGNKKLYLWVKDTAGNISDVASDDIDVWGFTDLSQFCGDPADVDIALDSHNKVHIVCKNGNGIYYITNQSGEWASETIHSLGNIDVSSPSIAIDSHDGIHVVFNVLTFVSGQIPVGLIQYSTKSLGASWTNSAAFNSYIYSRFIGTTSLSVDNHDKLHLTTFRSYLGTKNLWYANNVSGAWQIDFSVEPTTFLADKPQADLTLDNQGNPRICYSMGGQLVYAKKTGNSWTRLSNRLIRDGLNCSIATDKFNGNWIAYHDIQNAFSLMSFDVGTGNNPDVFLDLHTEASFTAGRNISLATDGDSFYIGFFDSLNNALYYTQGGDQDWFTLLLDSSGIQDQFPLKIAVDSDKKIHLLYYKMPGAKLVYATTR